MNKRFNFLGLLLAVLVVACGQNDKTAATSSESSWKSGVDDGVRGYTHKILVNGNNAVIDVSCNYSVSPATVGFSVNGKEVDANALKYTVDGEKFDQAEHVDKDCTVCTDNFVYFWKKLQTAKSIVVSNGDAKETFSVVNPSGIPSIGGANEACQTVSTINLNNNSAEKSSSTNIGGGAKADPVTLAKCAGFFIYRSSMLKVLSDKTNDLKKKSELAQTSSDMKQASVIMIEEARKGMSSGQVDQIMNNEAGNYVTRVEKRDPQVPDDANKQYEFCGNLLMKL